MALFDRFISGKTQSETEVKDEDDMVVYLKPLSYNGELAGAKAEKRKREEFLRKKYNIRFVERNGFV